jgi:hypothetical protein
MKVIRYSLPATVSAPLAAVGNKSFFVRSALSAFSRSKSCTPEFVRTSPALNAPQMLVASKLSMKADPDWYASMRRIANKVVTDRPRGERFSRFVAAALVWRQARA